MTTFDAQYQNTQPNSPKVDKLHKITVKSFRNCWTLQIYKTICSLPRYCKNAKYGLIFQQTESPDKNKITCRFTEPKLICYQKWSKSHQAGSAWLSDRQTGREK